MIDESELLQLKDLSYCFSVEMNHESTVKYSRKKNRDTSKNKDMLL